MLAGTQVFDRIIRQHYLMYMRAAKFQRNVLFCNVVGYPALAVDVLPVKELQSDQNDRPKSFLDDLLDGFLWGACPKHRRSRERNATRKFGFRKIRDHMTPKRNIVECLQCGHWREAHTICGKILKLAIKIEK